MKEEKEGEKFNNPLLVESPYKFENILLTFHWPVGSLCLEIESRRLLKKKTDKEWVVVFSKKEIEIGKSIERKR